MRLNQRDHLFAEKTLRPDNFPPLLNKIADPPHKLFQVGWPLHHERTHIAIVGTRIASVQGLRIAEEFAFCLAKRGLVIVSGLAMGIDAAAHCGALAAGGVTVAVLGSGLKNIQPRCNRPLAKKIIQTGTLLSEYQDDTPGYKQNFPERNRIIAGLSKATIVIEAPQRSGALITARLALEYQRDVYSVPGPINFEVCRGSNMLLKQGAHILTGVDDLLAEFGFAGGPVQLPLLLSPDESAVFEALSLTPLGREKLMQSLALPSARITAALTMLELKKLIAVAGDQILVTR